MTPVIFSERTYEHNGFTYTVHRVEDLDAGLNDFDTDSERAATWEQPGGWQFIGITVDIAKETATSWAIPTVVGRASLWGIESDSGDDYLAEVEIEVATEAEADLANLRAALYA